MTNITDFIAVLTHAQVALTSAGIVWHKQGRRNQRGVFTDFDLQCIIAGEITAQVNGRDFVAGPGDFIVHGPGYTFEELVGRDLKMVWVHFHVSTATHGNLLEGVQLPLLLTAGTHFGEEVDSLVEQLSAMVISWRRGAPWMRPAVAGVFHALLARVMVGAHSTGQLVFQNPRPAWVHRVCEWIELHYADDLANDVLAARAGLSSAHFAREFKRYVGLTPNRYLLERRLAHAAIMLTDNREATVASIADAVGFSDQFHFSRRFKEWSEGSSPTEYRQSYWQDG